MSSAMRMWKKLSLPFMSLFMAPTQTPRIYVWKCKSRVPFAGVRTENKLVWEGESAGACEQGQESVVPVPGGGAGWFQWPLQSSVSLYTLHKPWMQNISGREAPRVNQQCEKLLDQRGRKCCLILDNA